MRWRWPFRSGRRQAAQQGKAPAGDVPRRVSLPSVFPRESWAVAREAARLLLERPDALPDEAARALRPLLERDPSPEQITRALNTLGSLEVEQGQLDEARRHFEEALVIARDLNDRSHIAAILCNLGALARERGQLAEAQHFLLESLSHFQDVGDRLGIASVLDELSALAWRQGQPKVGARYALRSAVGFALVGSPRIQKSLDFLRRTRRVLGTDRFADIVESVIHRLPDPGYQIDQESWGEMIRMAVADSARASEDYADGDDEVTRAPFSVEGMTLGEYLGQVSLAVAAALWSERRGSADTPSRVADAYEMLLVGESHQLIHSSVAPQPAAVLSYLQALRDMTARVAPDRAGRTLKSPFDKLFAWVVAQAGRKDDPLREEESESEACEFAQALLDNEGIMSQNSPDHEQFLIGQFDPNLSAEEGINHDVACLFAKTVLSDEVLAPVVIPLLAEPLRGILLPQPTGEQLTQGAHAAIVVVKMLAKGFLGDPDVTQLMSAEVTEALRGVLLPQPSGEQLTQGAQAAIVVIQALEAQRTRKQLERDHELHLQNLLVEWIQTTGMEASMGFLTVHEDTLLTDEAEALLVKLGQAQQSRDALQLVQHHQRLLREARRNGIAHAYEDVIVKGRPHSLFMDPQMESQLNKSLAHELKREPSQSGGPAVVPKEVQEIVRALLADEQIAGGLKPLGREALTGLLAAHLTAEEAEQGMAALLAIKRALTVHARYLSQPILEWYRAPDWRASRRWLAVHLAELPDDAPEQLERAAEQARTADDENVATALADHARLLREARRVGVDAAYRIVLGSDELTDEQPSHESSETTKPILVDTFRLARAVGLSPTDPLLPTIQSLWQMQPTWEGNRDDVLLFWLGGMASFRVQRRFLESHLEVLAPGNDTRLLALEEKDRAHAATLLDALRPELKETVALAMPLSNDLWAHLLIYVLTMNIADVVVEQRHLLHDIANRGGDIQAIRDAYVNAHGGLALEIPTWLERALESLDALAATGPAYVTAAGASEILRSALAQSSERGDVAPQTQAELQVMLTDTLTSGRVTNANPVAFDEERISLLNSALNVYSRDQYPYQYALIQSQLGTVWNQRIAGEKRENLEQAIACHKRALEILEIFARGPFSKRYGIAQNDLGNALRERIAGERRDNIEQAIACYEQALVVRTLERFPEQYAITQNNLGMTLRERVAGEKRSNMERTIACHREALKVFTLERFPQQYAMCQLNLGNAYSARLAGEKRDNIERAIMCFNEALKVYTLDHFPQEYATAQISLGTTLRARIAGEQRDNIEQAIACYEQALQVFTSEHYPFQHALAQINMSGTLRERIAGNRRDNLERATAYYEQALKVLTLEQYPRQYAATQNGMGAVAADLDRWEQAASAWEAVSDAQDLALALSGSVGGRDASLTEGAGAATRAAYAHCRQREWVKAALSLEQGRARGLANMQRLQAGDSERISDPVLQTQYVDARMALNQTQIRLNSPMSAEEMADALATQGEHSSGTRVIDQQALQRAKREVELSRTRAFRQAKATFDAVVDKVRAAGAPADFLMAPLDFAALQRAAVRGGPGHALIYLGATLWGGLALGIFNTVTTEGATTRVKALDLPLLTEETVVELIQQRLASDDGRLVGGYLPAQEDKSLVALLQAWPGETLRDRARALRDACNERGTVSALDSAVWRMLATLHAYPAFAHLADTPIHTREIEDEGRLIFNTVLTADEIAILSSSLNQAHMRAELARCLTALASIALRPLADWLENEGATSVTLIPCGELATFPLAAAEVAPNVTFGERIPTSVAPSARSLLRDEAAHIRAREVRRNRVATLGDPRVSHQPLAWGEAEALTVARLARTLNLSAEARVQTKATHDWLLARLGDALLVDASCHGYFNVTEPLDSFLALAGATAPTRLTLRELLNQSIEGHGLLLGLRLLILSACQTSVLDVRGAQDEMRSLTAGVLEAGADAAMGALWSVDDKATYLLIVRFMQFWLPRIDTMPPAEALASAQHWLRTVSNRELSVWRYHDFPEPTTEEKREAGCAEPEHDPWHDEEAAQAAYAATSGQLQTTPGHDMPAAQSPVAPGRLVAVRGGGDRLMDPDEETAMLATDRNGARQERYDPNEAQYRTQIQARRGIDPDVCPFADPYYWAAFQITGW